MSELSRRLAEDAQRNLPRTLARTVWLQQQLAEFLRASSRANLPIVVLKGAALTETVYPQLGLRDFRDLDVLVRPNDAARARVILEALGYDADAMHWHDLEVGRDGQVDFSCWTAAGPVVLELHIDLLNNDLLHGHVRSNVEGVWMRARPVTLAGVPTWTLGPEDQLLHLCLHLAGHYLTAARSLQDIMHVCATAAIDWPLLQGLARESRMSRITFIGLWLAVELFGANVPPSVLSALAPRCCWLLTRLALRRAQDLVGHQTAALRLPLALLLCDHPVQCPCLPLLAFQRRRRRRHDQGMPVTWVRRAH